MELFFYFLSIIFIDLLSMTNMFLSLVFMKAEDTVRIELQQAHAYFGTMKKIKFLMNEQNIFFSTMVISKIIKWIIIN